MSQSGRWAYGITRTGRGIFRVELRRGTRTFPFMGEVQHETVFFSGRVQGVGFRYTAAQTAKEFEVAGHVANLADGRVRLEAEGAPAEIDAFVAAVQARMHGFIRRTERLAARRAPQFSGFSVQ